LQFLLKPFSQSTNFGLVMHNTYAIVPAAGRGLRMGGNEPKQFLMLMGKPVLARTIERLSEAPFISGIILVVPSDFLTRAEEMIQNYCRHLGSMVRVIAGGKERQDSVFNALRVLPTECGWVLIHDGVRPFVSTELLQETWKAAQQSGAAIAAMAATDTIKLVRNERVVETIPREQIKLVQTPQVFRKDLILGAYLEAQKRGWSATDDASLVEQINIDVYVVEGEYSNIKVTTPADLEWAAWFLSRGQNKQIRENATPE
jgi:2-C-methyl-D-erythritol 4-phosphate cytidylyltransferase